MEARCAVDPRSVIHAVSSGQERLSPLVGEICRCVARIDLALAECHGAGERVPGAMTRHRHLWCPGLPWLTLQLFVTARTPNWYRMATLVILPSSAG
jgi:hypothetical protein